MYSNITMVPEELELGMEERVPFSLYFSLLFVLGFCGNAVALWLIKGYKPQARYRPGRVFLLLLFLTDVCMSLFMTLPSLVTVLNNKWIFGHVLCCMQGFIETTLATAENMVILFMGVERVLLLYKPFSILVTNRKVFLSGLLSITLGITNATLQSTLNKFTFSNVGFRCMADLYPESVKSHNTILIANLVFMILPLILIIVSYIMMVAKALTCGTISGKVFQRQYKTQILALRATLAVVGIYLLSVMPLVVARSLQDPDLLLRKVVGMTFLINTSVNPFIYIYTNRSFKRYSMIKIPNLIKNETLKVRKNLQVCLTPKTGSRPNNNPVIRIDAEDLSINIISNTNRLELLDDIDLHFDPTCMVSPVQMFGKKPQGLNANDEIIDDGWSSDPM